MSRRPCTEVNFELQEVRDAMMNTWLTEALESWQRKPLVTIWFTVMNSNIYII
jgi:hypothetical protein